MGVNFHITSVREGSIFNVMQFLSLEKVTGILSVSFGSHIPEVAIYFASGDAATAEFGHLVGDAVLDVLLCQEYSIKEINFAPGRISHINDKALIVKASSLSGAMLQASKDVDRCQARPFIYGLLPVHILESDVTELLLQLLFDFEKVGSYLEQLPVKPDDKKAPLPECVLLHRALSSNVITYNTALVSLKALKPIIEAIQPLSEKETGHLRGYMRSLLPHPRSTHFSIDRFYAFASAIESVAQRRGTETSEQVKRLIYRLIQVATTPGETMKISS